MTTSCLAVDSGPLQDADPLPERSVAKLVKPLESLNGFGRQPMSRAPQRLAVGGVSGTKLTPQDPADARQSGPPGLVGANDVSSVLAVEDAWLRIVEHLTVSARNDLICPPIMGNDVRRVPGRVLQNVERRTVQDHAVADHSSPSRPSVLVSPPISFLVF